MAEQFTVLVSSCPLSWGHLVTGPALTVLLNRSPTGTSSTSLDQWLFLGQTYLQAEKPMGTERCLIDSVGTWRFQYLPDELTISVSI